MDVSAFLAQLEALPSYSGQIVHREDIPARDAVYGSLDRPLSPRLQRALEDTGVHSLYSHQAEAINASRRGENVIVATPSASGKSLCYHIPVIDSLLSDKGSRALYLFPTKALTQDQANTNHSAAPRGQPGAPRHLRRRHADAGPLRNPSQWPAGSDQP